ncbi:RHS domain-containing protein [Enterobacter cloacae]|nr:RHS domain-containing protein [Enterobacter cloacae]HBL4974253.1 RHS domain-containing protein [Enterobacter cloacae]HDC4293138.1 RHS domain-containing protein [Enterobacter cloacae]
MFHANRHFRDPSGQITRIRRTPTAEGVALGIESDEIAYRHDAAGRVLSESGINGAVGYEWDALSNLTGLTLPGEQKLAWLHYGSGHVSAIRFGQQLVTEFTRDRLHREVRRTQGAREQLRQYDSLGRRTLQRSELSTDVTLPEQAILERLYRYTARGELSGVSDTLRGEVDYGYDAEGRLLKHYEARQGHSRAQFSYDAADNLAANDDAVPVTDNRLQHWQALFMKYDHWGNLVSRRNGLYEQHYAYDAENRLVSARGTGPEGRFEARYHYDALGRRTRKIVTTAHGTTETRFLWQGYRLLQEQQQTGLCSTYIYDPNEAWSPLARVDHLRDQSSGEIYWFNTDLNGAPLEVTDERGAVRWSGQYGSFGEVRHQSEGFSRVVNRTAMAHQPLRYAGQYADGETGLHYNLFRYYDPQVGRFIVQDPIGLAGGNLNLYHYAPNPLVWIDPMGLALSGVDFSGSPSLYPVTGTQRNIVEITLQGSRGRDFTEAYKLAGISEADASEYTWHHLDDFDPKTGKSTMQLVTTEAHKASFPHKGSVSQFEKHFGVKYGSPEAIKISHSKGWLRGRIPKHCQ